MRIGLAVVRIRIAVFQADKHAGKPKALHVVGFAKGRRTVVGGGELVEVTFAVIACAD